jgi:hypothetical protein
MLVTLIRNGVFCNIKRKEQHTIHIWAKSISHFPGMWSFGCYVWLQIKNRPQARLHGALFEHLAQGIADCGSCFRNFMVGDNNLMILSLISYISWYAILAKVGDIVFCKKALKGLLTSYSYLLIWTQIKSKNETCVEFWRRTNKCKLYGRSAQSQAQSQDHKIGLV